MIYVSTMEHAYILKYISGRQKFFQHVIIQIISLQIKAREQFVHLLLNTSQPTHSVMSGRHHVSGLHFMLTSIQHWDVMTCKIKFEIWNPSNKQTFICMDGLTQPLFKDRLRPFKRLTSNHMVGQSE